MFWIVALLSASRALGPLGPESAVFRTLTFTLLPSTRAFSSVSVAASQAQIAASAPNGSPTELVTLTRFPLSAESRIVAVASSASWMPPPNECA